MTSLKSIARIKTSFSHLVNELDALQEHVVMVMLVHQLLINKVARLQCRVIWGETGLSSHVHHQQLSSTSPHSSEEI